MEINSEGAAQLRGVEGVSLSPPFGPTAPRRYRTRETDRGDRAPE